jgi:hypothetical protein
LKWLFLRRSRLLRRTSFWNILESMSRQPAGNEFSRGEGLSPCAAVQSDWILVSDSMLWRIWESLQFGWAYAQFIPDLITLFVLSETCNNDDKFQVLSSHPERRQPAQNESINSLPNLWFQFSSKLWMARFTWKQGSNLLPRDNFPDGSDPIDGHQFLREFRTEMEAISMTHRAPSRSAPG